MQSRLNKASAMTYFCFTSLVMEYEFDKMSLIPYQVDMHFTMTKFIEVDKLSEFNKLKTSQV